MNTKQSSLPNSEAHLSRIHIKAEIKRLVQKIPGIFEGNLRYRIREMFPQVSYTDVTLVLMDLVEENYFINHSNSIYPPEKTNIKEKKLLKFAYFNKLNDMSIGILLCVEDMGTEANRLRDVSRYFVSRYTDYDEIDAKLRISELTIRGLLIGVEIGDGKVCLSVNWKLIQGV